MSDSPHWHHCHPVRITSASLEAVRDHVQGKKVLIVTTPGFVRRGVVDRLKDILAPHRVSVWDGVRPNPDVQDLDRAADTLRHHHIDNVIGLGGGSAVDAAKVLATTLPNATSPTLSQIFREPCAVTWGARLPLIAIPTTSGTGAEVTPFATVWDHERHAKYSLTGDFMYPDLALLDASLTLTLGTEDTLYPALDAISHALESLWNRNRTPITTLYAYSALERSTVALPIALSDPANWSARSDLQNASLFAGLAISHTRTAIAHAISYPLTTHFGVPHGLACKVL